MVLFGLLIGGAAASAAAYSYKEGLVNLNHCKNDPELQAIEDGQELADLLATARPCKEKVRMCYFS